VTEYPAPPRPGLDRQAKVVVACVVALGLLAVGLGIAALRADDDDDEAEPVAPVQTDDTVPLDELEVGDCFEDQEAVGISGIPPVPCGEPHDNETFHLFDVPSAAGDPYPGDDAIAEVVGRECLAPFEGFVGVAFEQSALEIFPISPSREVWETGVREVICAVYNPAGQVTGTLRGSRR